MREKRFGYKRGNGSSGRRRRPSKVRGLYRIETDRDWLRQTFIDPVRISLLRALDGLGERSGDSRRRFLLTETTQNRRDLRSEKRSGTEGLSSASTAGVSLDSRRVPRSYLSRSLQPIEAPGGDSKARSR